MYQPFFWRRCRGSNFAIPIRLLETLLVSFIFILVLFIVISLPFVIYLKTQKKLVTCSFTIIGENTKKIITMAQKKLGEYAIPNDDFIRAPIT